MSFIRGVNHALGIVPEFMRDGKGECHSGRARVRVHYVAGRAASHGRGIDIRSWKAKETRNYERKGVAMNWMRWAVGMSVCGMMVGTGVAAEKSFFTPKQDRGSIAAESSTAKGLPNVLIIGDSISIGYTKPVIAELEGVANVKRAKANCGDTNRGLNSLDQWLGKTKWDVIHFDSGCR